jgi:hypothetical protein
VVDYVGRLTHRMAISNHRIVDVEGAHAKFNWRVSGRYYGFRGNRPREETLEQCRQLLHVASEVKVVLSPRHRRTIAIDTRDSWAIHCGNAHLPSSPDDHCPGSATSAFFAGHQSRVMIRRTRPPKSHSPRIRATPGSAFARAVESTEIVSSHLSVRANAWLTDTARLTALRSASWEYRLRETHFLNSSPTPRVSALRFPVQERNRATTRLRQASIRKYRTDRSSFPPHYHLVQMLIRRLAQDIAASTKLICYGPFATEERKLLCSLLRRSLPLGSSRI